MGLKENLCGIADQQEILLDILKEFIRLCDRHDLQYWLAFGSLLGAIRNQGFIPWDDDLDVLMPRRDYEKLWELYEKNKIDGHYVLCRTTRKKNYHHRVMQLVDTNTTFIHSRSRDEDLEHGLYIDIIPLDACPNSKLRRLAQMRDAVIYSVYNIQCTPEYNGGKLKGIITFLVKIMLTAVQNPQRRYEIWKAAERRMTQYEWDDCKCVKSICGMFSMLVKPLPKTWFIGNRIGVFEDIKVSIPVGAEAFLTAKYGNYMKLPPKEQQVVRHRTEYIDLHTTYKEYRGIYYCIGTGK